jgi:hypothetical protein
MKVTIDKDQIIGSITKLMSQLHRSLMMILLAMAIGLSGCVKYDTSIHFSSLNQGEIVAHIQLGEQLNSFSQNAVQAWLGSIQERTKQAEGKLDRINDREFKVTIPFNNTQQLIAKIDRYFNPQPLAPTDKSQFNAHLKIEQSNFLLAVRNHLIYEIDLRSLSLAEPLQQKIQSSNSQVSFVSNNSIDLNFSLESPWGVKNSDLPGNIVGVKTINNHQLNWQLKPGKINHLDAIFWLPNSLGIGAILIILISGVGYYLKYRQLPWQSEG